MTLGIAHTTKPPPRGAAAAEVLLKPVLLVLCALLVLRVAISFVGFDHMPLMPLLGDEVTINEPAVTLAQSGHFVAGDVHDSAYGLDRFYGHFPPLYMLVVAASLKIFGVSAASIRLGAIFASDVAIALMLLGMTRAWTAGMIGKWGLLLSAGLFMLDAGFFTISRWGRMDSTMLLFAFAAMACLIFIEAGAGLRRRWLFPLGGVFLGLAGATHFEAAVYGIPFCLYAIVRYRQLGKGLFLLGLIAAAATAAVVCLSVWGMQWETALDQMRMIAANAPGPGLALHAWVSDAVHLRVRDLWSSGGSAQFFLLAAPLVFAVIAVPAARTRNVPAPAIGFFWFTGACASLLLLMYEFAIPYSLARLTAGEPIALVSLAASLTVASPILRRSGLVLAALLAVADLGGLAAYAHTAQTQWQIRSPDRFDRLLSAYPETASVLGPPELWYALIRRAAPHGIYGLFPEDRPLIQSDTRLLEAYDVVILKADDPLVATVARTHPQRRTFTDGWNNYVTLSR